MAVSASWEVTAVFFIFRIRSPVVWRFSSFRVSSINPKSAILSVSMVNRLTPEDTSLSSASAFSVICTPANALLISTGTTTAIPFFVFPCFIESDWATEITSATMLLVITAFPLLSTFTGFDFAVVGVVGLSLFGRSVIKALSEGSSLSSEDELPLV